MLTWVFIFLGAVGLTAVLILIGLAIATLEEICKREVIDKMRWRDPNPGRDGRSVEHGKEIKRDFMSTVNEKILYDEYMRGYRKGYREGRDVIVEIFDDKMKELKNEIAEEAIR